jgi:hypothetical protein
MKKNNLTRKQKSSIHKWLTLGKNRGYECPFYREINIVEDDIDYCRDVCQKLFPKTSIVYYNEVTQTERVQCPCDQLEVKYVVRKAKEFIK